MKILNEFKAFILRGNVVDLAVGVVIGAAFQSLVTAFVQDMLTPIISIPGHTDFFRMSFNIHGSTFLIGSFLNAVISFILLAAVVFFLVVRPINILMTLSQRVMPEEAKTRECPFCISMVSVRATRCAYCTAELPVPPPAEHTGISLRLRVRPRQVRNKRAAMPPA